MIRWKWEIFTRAKDVPQNTPMKLSKLENIIMPFYVLTIGFTIVLLNQANIPEKQSDAVLIGLASIAPFVLSFRSLRRMGPRASCCQYFSASPRFIALNAKAITMNTPTIAENSPSLPI